MCNPKNKPHKRYLLYRVFCIATFAAWVILWFLSFTSGRGPDQLLPLLPAFVPAMFMIFNLMAFRYPYSLFGPLQRSSPPDETPIATSRFTSGAIGWFQASSPFFSWYLYPTGIAFTILGVGRGFVPLTQVSSLKDGLFAFKVSHNSLEVRGALSFTSRKLYDALSHRLQELGWPYGQTGAV